MSTLSHLEALEGEAVAILRDGFAEARNPVLLFSGGKDSTVLAHLCARAFFPSRPPIPLLHVDSTWEFSDVLAFRNDFACRHGFELRIHANEEGRREGLNPFDHGDSYTLRMRTEALKQALDKGAYDMIFGGARRDEDAARAKERIVSIREPGHVWTPRQQRPELWSCFNWRLAPGQTARVYPLSNWTELDLWAYIAWRGIEIAPLYFAEERFVVERAGQLIVVDEPERMRWNAGESAHKAQVRFRTLGCWPVTACARSEAATLEAVILETMQAKSSERSGRVGDGASLERHKQEGYF